MRIGLGFFILVFLPAVGFSKGTCRALYSSSTVSLNGVEVSPTKSYELEANLTFKKMYEPSAMIQELLTRFSDSNGLHLRPALESTLYPSQNLQIENKTVSVGSYVEKTLHYTVRDVNGVEHSVRYKKTFGSDLEGKQFSEDSRTKKELTFKSVVENHDVFQVRAKNNMDVTGVEVSDSSIQALVGQVLGLKVEEVKIIGRLFTHRMSLTIANEQGQPIGFLALDRVRKGDSDVIENGMEIEIFSDYYSRNKTAAETLVKGIAESTGGQITFSGKVQEYLD